MSETIRTKLVKKINGLEKHTNFSDFFAMQIHPATKHSTQQACRLQRAWQELYAWVSHLLFTVFSLKNGHTPFLTCHNCKPKTESLRRRMLVTARRAKGPNDACVRVSFVEFLFYFEKITLFLVFKNWNGKRPS